jgi:hypothetical protein
MLKDYKREAGDADRPAGVTVEGSAAIVVRGLHWQSIEWQRSLADRPVRARSGPSESPHRLEPDPSGHPRLGRSP